MGLLVFQRAHFPAQNENSKKFSGKYKQPCIHWNHWIFLKNSEVFLDTRLGEGIDKKNKIWYNANQ